MSMTYVESAGLMTDPVFASRVKVACLHFAEYILNEPTSTTAHNTRYKWAKGTAEQPDSAAAAIIPIVVMDPNVQSAGSAITDAALQTAVETALNAAM